MKDTNTKDPIRIFSIEDHWVVVKGLTVFRGDREGVYVACDAENMIEALERDPDDFDLILLDLMIPDTDPEDNVKALKKQYPGKPIIIFTSQENSTWELKMYRLGVQGFLIKTCERKVFLETVRNVHDGMNYGDQRLQELEKGSSANVDEIWDQLNEKEKEILGAYLKDDNIKNLAKNLDKSNTRIYQILTSIRKKLNLGSNVSLVKFFGGKV